MRSLIYIAIVMIFACAALVAALPAQPTDSAGPLAGMAAPLMVAMTPAVTSTPSVQNDGDAYYFVNACGEWTIDANRLDDVNVVTGHLNGERSFMIVYDIEERPEGHRVRVSIGNDNESCLLATSWDNQNPCYDYADLLNASLLCDGTLTLAELLTAMKNEYEAHQSQSNDPQSNPGYDCDFVEHNDWIVCDCPSQDYGECFACCSDVYPEPYPGSTLPNRAIANWNL